MTARCGCSSGARRPRPTADAGGGTARRAWKPRSRTRNDAPHDRQVAHAGTALEVGSRVPSRAELLRRQHLPARAAAARPGRDRARAREPCRSRPRCWCSTTARATAPRRRRASTRRSRRRSRWTSAAARRSTTPSCCAARAGATRCCSTRTPSCAPGRRSRCGRRSQERPRAACAGARLLRPDGRAQACAWRFPTVATALAGALMLHRLYTVQSRGERVREVDWCQSSALLVRREAAAQVGYLDPDFFVYSDEVDFARRLRDAGWRSVYVPQARRRPPRAARHRRAARAADRRTVARARPVHAQAPLRRERPRRALADRVELRAARARRARAARARPAALLAPRRRRAAPRPRRGAARGGR